MSRSQCCHQCQWESDWQFSQGLASVWNLDTPEHKSLMPGSSVADWHLSQTHRHGVAILLRMTCPTFAESKGSDGCTNDNYLLVSSWHGMVRITPILLYVDSHIFFCPSYCKELFLLLNKAGCCKSTQYSREMFQLQATRFNEGTGFSSSHQVAETFSLPSLKQYDFLGLARHLFWQGLCVNTRVSGHECSVKFDPLHWFDCSVHEGWVCLKCLEV